MALYTYQIWCYIYPFWSCLIYNLYVMIYICPGTVFQWEFNGGVYFCIGLTNFGNFLILHMCIWFMHCFSTRIQWSLWLCNHGGVWAHHMIWVLSAIDFYFALNRNGYFTIRDNIIAIYDMGTIRMHFWIHIQIFFNTLYDWRILSHNVFQPYLSFNSMCNEKSILMMPISYIAIILSLMVK